MQQRLIKIPEHIDKDGNNPVTSLSFRPFLAYIRERYAEKDSIKKDIYSLILKKFEAYPETSGTIEIENVGRYKELLDLLYMVLTSLADDEKKTVWGLSVPVSPLLFYGSDALYSLLLEAETQQIQQQFLESNNLIEQKKKMLYTFLLQKFYNYQFEAGTDMTSAIRDPQSGLVKYYKINIDTRFVEVTANGNLPELNLETLHLHLHESTALGLLERLLPLNIFHFSGFSILTITDITPQQALSQIRDLLVNSHGKQDKSCYQAVTHALQSITGTTELSFNLLPLLRINKQIAHEQDTFCQSVLFSVGKNQHIREQIYMPLLKKFETSARMVYFRDVDTSEQTHIEIINLLKKSGIKSYALVPVYFGNRLAGTLEIYSRLPGLLDENTFAHLDAAIPMLAQLMQNATDEFEEQINKVIREKFTSLQPSVEWKFNEAALEYLQHASSDKKKYTIRKIEFPKVYPLYGAIDMRNSTTERNKAVFADMQYQLQLLQNVFKEFKQLSGFGLADEFAYKASQWQKELQQGLTTHDEIKINQFLAEEAHPFLEHFRQSHPQSVKLIDDYFDATNTATGQAWFHRRQLEESMQYINGAINNYLDLMNVEIQQAYPAYFEKFRTDGIEYDIYIGQSIAPEKPFNTIYLKNLRRWQLGSMAAIARLANSVKPDLKVILETTQLIFAYSNPIDISFRNDERRFDVEGGYNIRYHILKKRIDKVLIKGTGERLTQPGKVAIIYFDQKDADEYTSYMRHYQEKGLLLNDLEYLELEELQGVSGLKALRIGVDLNSDLPE